MFRIEVDIATGEERRIELTAEEIAAANARAAEQAAEPAASNE